VRKIRFPPVFRSQRRWVPVGRGGEASSPLSLSSWRIRITVILQKASSEGELGGSASSLRLPTRGDELSSALQRIPEMGSGNFLLALREILSSSRTKRHRKEKGGERNIACVFFRKKRRSGRRRAISLAGGKSFLLARGWPPRGGRKGGISAGRRKGRPTGKRFSSSVGGEGERKNTL